MILSLKDPQVDSTFQGASQQITRTITVGNTAHPLTTPFASPADWRDVWMYFLMVDRFNRSDVQPPKSMPYDKPFGGYQGGTFNGIRQRLQYIKASSAESVGAFRLWELSEVVQ